MGKYTNSRFHFAVWVVLSLLFATPGEAQVASLEAPDRTVTPTTAKSKIELTSPDTRMARRLDGIFDQMDGLAQIHANVHDGVVSLSGTALTAEDRQKAGEVASRLAGVVSVKNDIEIEHKIGRRLEPMLASVQDMARQAVAFLPLLLVSVIVFVAFWALGRLLTRTAGLFQRIAPNPLVQTLAEQLVRLIFILVGLILAMRIMGATALLGSVLGAAGVLGLAIGFAVRDTIENYIASVLLSVRRPFAPNDHVIIEGLEGRVTRLNSRATFLTSFDGNELRIPNAIVYKAKIINFSQIKQRRFEFAVGVGYENDLDHALVTALSALRASPGVLAAPQPAALIDALGASTISVKVLGWVDQTQSDFAKVRSAAIRSVKEAFDKESISMPVPIQNIRAIENWGATPKPCAKAAPAETQEVEDTSADRTIEAKVSVLRSKGEQDLLSEDAPRE